MLLAYNTRRTLADGCSVPPWIFCTSTGTPLDESQLRKRFARVLKKAGLPHFRLYDLRHTFATLLLNRGVPITYVSKQLGHANQTTTSQWDADALPTATAHYVDLLDGTPEARVPATPTAHYVDQLDGDEPETRASSSPLAPSLGTTAVSETPPPNGSIEILGEMTNGPARNRTANPLIKSPLGDTTTTDHGGPPPAISEEYES